MVVRCWSGRRVFRRGAWILLAVCILVAHAFVLAQQPSTTNSEPPLRVRVSQGVARRLLVKKVQPQYPGEARRGHIQGDAVLKALIDTTGSVRELDVVSGEPSLVQAAIEAVKQWKYKPYLLNGQPVEVETQIVVNFELSTR